MLQHRVTPYVIRFRNKSVKKRDKADSFYKTNAVQGDNKAIDLFKEFFVQYKDFKNDTVQKQFGAFSEFTVSNNTAVGAIRLGNYGVPSEIYDTATAESKFKVGKDLADVLRFYIYFSFPPGANEGIVLIHQIGTHGTKSYFMKNFSEYLKSRLANVKFEMNPLGYVDVYKEWAKYQTNEISFVEYKGSTDISDITAGLGHIEKNIVIKAKKGKKLPDFETVVEELSSEGKNLAETVSPVCREVSIKIKGNGKSHTVKLIQDEDSMISCSIDLDEELSSTDGSLNKEKFITWSTDYVNDLDSNLYKKDF